MASITETAHTFFLACETGQGWAGCARYCTPGATFSVQAEPLAETTTVEGYCEWMKGLLSFIPDGNYDLKSFATDETRRNVTVFATFHGTHTGEGGPLPPTGRSFATDYVYSMQFEADRIAHMTKVWNSGWALKELGWA